MDRGWRNQIAKITREREGSQPRPVNHKLSPKSQQKGGPIVVMVMQYVLVFIVSGLAYLGCLCGLVRLIDYQARKPNPKKGDPACPSDPSVITSK